MNTHSYEDERIMLQSSYSNCVPSGSSELLKECKLHSLSSSELYYVK